MRKLTYLLMLCVAVFAFNACGQHNEPEHGDTPSGDSIIGYEAYPKTIIGSWKIESCMLTSITQQTTTDLTPTSYKGKHIESFNDKGSHPVFEDGMLINHTNYKFKKDTMIFFDDYNTFADEYVIKSLTNDELVYTLYGEGYFITYTFSRHADFSEELVGTWSVDRFDPNVELADFTVGTKIEFKDNGVMYVVDGGDELERFFFVAGDDLNLESKIFHIVQCDDNTLIMEYTVEGAPVRLYFSR